MGGRGGAYKGRESCGKQELWGLCGPVLPGSGALLWWAGPESTGVGARLGPQLRLAIFPTSKIDLMIGLPFGRKAERAVPALAGLTAAGLGEP